MSRFNEILLVFAAFFVLHNTGNAQQKSPAKINDIFFEYVAKTLELKPSEAVLMRPLVKKYLDERKKIYGRFSDPLEREQEILNLKISSRKEMTPIVGLQKANAFFSSEQNFRRKVREELKQRHEDQKKN
jgi:hypothetical protein